jgi:NitT/TauT family transport system permease protein
VSILPGTAILIGLIGTWEWAARGFALSELVLPAPSRIAQSLWAGLASGFFWPHIAQTVFELLAGLALGAGFGFGAGVLLGESVLLRRIAMPYIVTSQVLPKLALAPLMIVWLGFGALPIVVITSLICFFPLLENTMTAVQQADPNRRELFRMLGASRWQTLWRLKIPAGLPGILAGLRIAVVLALVGAVVAEFIGASQGLGALIIAAQGSMDTPLMFAVLVLITLIGLASYQCTIWLEHRLLRIWRLIE